MSGPQMCTVDDLIGGEPCLRVAQWKWAADGEHPVHLCNFHAEPLLDGAAGMTTAAIPNRQEGT